MSIIVAPLVDIFTVWTCTVFCNVPKSLRAAFKHTHRLWENVFLVFCSYILALLSTHRALRYTYANTHIYICMCIYMQTHKGTCISLFPKQIKHIRDMCGFIILHYISCIMFYNKSLKAKWLHSKGRGKGRALHTLGNWATGIALVKPTTRCKNCRNLNIPIYCAWWKKHGDREIRESISSLC